MNLSKNEEFIIPQVKKSYVIHCDTIMSIYFYVSQCITHVTFSGLAAKASYHHCTIHEETEEQVFHP